jgi:hypothetical protein
VSSPSNEPPRLRLPPVVGTSRSPPAIWAALLQQGQWKSWALVLAFSLCALEALVALRLAGRPPDIVLVAPDGQSSYLSPSVAGEALLRFLREQRQLPSDVTVVHFTRDFVRHFFALDSATAEASFAEALTMMTAGLRGPIAQEAEEKKLLEGLRASHTRAELVFEALDIVERNESAFLVNVLLRRRTEQLESGALLSEERLRVDIHQWIVPRSPAHPDGLVVGHLSSHPLGLDDASKPAEPASTPPRSRRPEPAGPGHDP